MDISVIANTGLTLFTRTHNTSFFEWWFNNAMRGPSILMHFGTVLIWIVLGAIMAKKAKEVGLNPTVHFILCFFLHLIGVVISVVIIDKRKKDIIHSRSMYGQPPYGQPQQPFYTNTYYYGQQPNAQQGMGYRPQQFNYYNGVNPAQHDPADTYCPNCGTPQKDGVFCRVCGTRIR